MMLFYTVKMNVVRYRVNPVMIVPPLVEAVIFQLFASLLVPPPNQRVLVGFVISLLTMVSFLVLLGQASMAGRVVVEGRTRLADWGEGIKKYFSRALGIYLIYLGIGITCFPPTMRLVSAILPQQIPWRAHLMMTTCVGTLLATVVSAVFYMWLAPAIIEDKGIFASLGAGTKTVRKGGKLFLGFIALFFIASMFAQLIETLPILGATIQPVCYNGCEILTDTLSQVITTIFSPLWFLIAFTIYSEQKLT